MNQVDELRNKDDGGIVDRAQLSIAFGCSLQCTFCHHANGQNGIAIEHALTDDFRLPRASRIDIGSGNAANIAILPIVKRLRAAGTDEIFAYCHSASDFKALFDLADAGLTGIHLVLPAADRDGIARFTGGRGTVASTARLLEAASRVGLVVDLEIPVVADNFTGLDDTLARALTKVTRPGSLDLPFLAEMKDGQHLRWDFRAAMDNVIAAKRRAEDAGMTVRLDASFGPPPCMISLENARPVNLPGIDSPTRKQPQDRILACTDCAAAVACRADLRHFIADPALGPVLQIPTDEAVKSTSAALLVRKTSVENILAQAALTGRCPAPWDSLEIHDQTGRIAPCEGRWPRREFFMQGEDWRKLGILGAWNSTKLQAFRQTMTISPRKVTCNRHCPRFLQGVGDQPPMPVARGRNYYNNLVQNLSEMVRGDSLLKSRPRHLSISPTFACNHDCIMCDLRDDAPDGLTRSPLVEMPQTMFDELSELLETLSTLALTGGEPLLSSRVWRLLETADEDTTPDLAVTLTTNGELLTPARIRTLARSRLRRVFVSLNSATPDTHSFVSGAKHGFERVVSNVRSLIDSARLMPLKPEVVLSFVVMRCNLDELGRFLDLADSIGAGIRLLPMERNHGGQSLFVDEGGLRRLIDVTETVSLSHVGRDPNYSRELARLTALARERLVGGIFAPL